MERQALPPINGTVSSHPHLSWALSGPGHAVHFYDDDNYLKSVVTGFLADGLQAGQAVVSIATAPHTALFIEGLQSRGLDVAALQASCDLQLMDAQVVLNDVMVGPWLDANRFHAVVGRILNGCGGRRRVVRAYGEMVDVLWNAGNVETAVKMEKAWNRLGGLFHFALLCSYSVGSLTDVQHLAAFERVCGEHHHVIPTNRHTAAD
jgi:hypothetical protein